jgi:chromosome segregation protein
LWRWDGFVASADAPSVSAVRLAQRNRLSALEGELETARQARGEVFASYSAAKDAAQSAREALRAAEQQERSAEQALIGSQDQATRAARAAAERASQLASLEAEIRRLTQSVEAAEESKSSAVGGLEELGDGVELNQKVADTRGQTADEADEHGIQSLRGLERRRQRRRGQHDRGARQQG